mgnify:CR=1 FL=1
MGLSDSKLETSRALWEAVGEISEKLTEFARKACEKLGLNPEVSVLVSLRRFCEEDFERVREVERRKPACEICGYYYPEKRLITISIPCVFSSENSAWRLAETLAHELIHHGQFTGWRLCEIHLDLEQASRVRAALPYDIRPHEVEAYEKQGKLALELQNVVGFNEIFTQIERLYSADAAAIVGGAVICFSFIGRLDNLAKNVAESLVKLVGENVLKSTCAVEDLPTKIREYTCIFLENTHIKAFLTYSDNYNVLNIFIITNRGFTIVYRLVKADNLNTLLSCISVLLESFKGNLPILPIFLKPKEESKLIDIKEGNIVSPLLKCSSLKYVQLIDGSIKVNNREYEVGAVRRSRVLQKVCDEIHEEGGRPLPALNAADFLALLLLAGWRPGAPVSVSALGETECSTIAVESAEGSEPKELVVSNHLRLVDETAGITGAVKDVARRLNDEAFIKELAAELLKVLQSTR